MSTRVLDYLAEPQTAVVFDIDGVLAAYEFGNLCHSACPDEDWETYVRQNDPYASVPAIPQLQDFVSLKDSDRVFACSVAQDYEAAGKRDFVLRNYAIPARNVRIVSSKAEKIDYLREVARTLGVPERRVALVEDTVKTLDLVSAQTDCVTVHVSSFFLWRVPR